MGGRRLQAPTGSTQDQQPRGPARVHLHSPPAFLAKLRLTRQARTLLWLTVALLAVADGRLLLGGSAIAVTVQDRSASLPAAVP